MADLTNSSWSETDSSNTQPAPSGFPSGILPSQVGGVVRAMMGATKRAYNHGNAMVTSTGSANAYVLTYEQPLQSGYVKGEVFRFFAHVTNTGASTLNINGAGTRAILRADGSQVAAGEIVIGQVVTVVCDGTNFLAPSVVSKDFKSSVSVTLSGDAVLTLEDSGAPANTFRSKKIYSSRNVNGGNDWLFRQVRPSDGAVEDFTFKSGTAGTIWTTGNFNPALKADLAGSVFTGYVTVKSNAGGGSATLLPGNAERSGHVEFRDKDGARHGYIGWGNGTTIDIAAEKGDYNFVNGTPKIGGNPIWHSGNFTPSLKADLNSTVRFTGSFLGSGQGYIYGDPGSHNVVLRSGTGEAATPHKYAALQNDVFRTYSVDMLADGNLRATGRVVVGEGQTSSYIEMRDTDEGTRYVHNNSGNIGFLGNDAQWKLRVNDTGQVYTAQLGDLSTRIDTVATAQGNRGRDEANNNTNANFFNKTTGTQQNVNNIPSFNAAAIDIVRGGVMRARWTVDGGGTTILQNGDNGDNFFYVTTGGGVWTKQFGDLNNRIENRAADWARQESVARANERVAKTGDTMTGDLHINKAWPTLNLTWGGVRSVGWQVRDDAQTYLWDHTAGTWNMRVDTGGSIVARGSVYTGNGSANLATNGDVWGAAWGNRWLSARVNEVDGNANNRVAKTGDTMSGDLEIGKAYPNLKLHYHGVRIWDIQVREDGRLYFWGGDGQVTMSVGTGGDINTRQLGDLNNRIETRARAWAETRQANLGFTPVEQGGGPYQSGNKVRLGWDGSALRASIDGLDHERILHRSWVNPIIDVRLAYAGDLDNNWNFNAGNYAEPYGGAVITTRATVGTASGDRIWGGGRWRYLQKQDSYGNWYTVGYA